MKHYRVALPKWKAYLYSLAQRWRRYLWINKGMLTYGFSVKENGLIHRMMHKYLRKEVLRQTRGIIYYELVKVVLGSKLAIATREEIQVANKLFIAYKTNIGDLIMELKQLKEFAKEVGLDSKKIKGMDEDELALEILRNTDSEKAYSDEFIEWYEELPEEIFDSVDAIEEEKSAKDKGKGKPAKEEEEEVTDFSELIEAINDAESIDDLVELGQDEDFEEIFAEVDFDTKMIKKLKKAMLAAIENYSAEEEEAEEEEEEPVKETKKAKPVKEEKTVRSKAKPEPVKETNKKKPAKVEEETSGLAAELKEAIDSASDAEELKEVADSVKDDHPELFKGIAFRQGRGKSPFRTDVKAIKKEMIARLADLDEGGESEEEETAELDITAELVNDAVEAEDKDALQEMCATLDIKLGALEKRSITKMAEKILDKLPKESKKPAKRTEKVKEAKPKAKGVDAGEESKSIYQIIEELVESGGTEKAMINAVTPVLSERGKNKIQILKWVRQMVAVVEAAAEED